jgi:hypothetical protein
MTPLTLSVFPAPWTLAVYLLHPGSTSYVLLTVSSFVQLQSVIVSARQSDEFSSQCRLTALFIFWNGNKQRFVVKIWRSQFHEIESFGLPLNEFLWNFIIEYFSKICRQWPVTCIPMYKCDNISQILRRMRDVSGKFIEKEKAHNLCSIFFHKIILFMR